MRSNPNRVGVRTVQSMTRLLVLATGLLALGLLGAAGGGAAPGTENKLHAKVGPGFTITLTDDAGAKVTKLDPGRYEIEVEDESDAHNFHLFGPGVDRTTSVVGQGKETWTVALSQGTYTYLCDPHASTMRGTFTVGNPSGAPSPPRARTVTAKTRLVLTSGPGFTITLRTAKGQQVTRMKRGTYTIVVRDRSRIHNARIVAPGFKRATTLRFVGTRRWKVALRRLGTFRFVCDPHALTGMRGSARIVK